MTPLEQRLYGIILGGGNTFTADDITNYGHIAVDPAHAPNGKQSSIGSAFRQWAKRGLITPTGRHTRSAARHRKGGMIQIWEVTEAGRLWAKSVNT